MSDRTKNFSTLQAIIGHDFANPGLLAEALRHASAAAPGATSYQRLEFLGDRVLGLVMAEMLLAHFPADAEGPLARRHAAMVRKETLAAVSEEMDLGAYLLVSPGEEAAGTRESTGVLADACEALIGALFLDGGYEKAANFVRRFWGARLVETVNAPVDGKTALQEWAQKQGLNLPVYRVVERTGPDHAPEFVISLSIDGEASELGRGASRRAAEQDAAARFLAKRGLAS
ncbi:MAG: ribonuclease III [Alphaproteobacteria bacterium]